MCLTERENRQTNMQELDHTPHFELLIQTRMMHINKDAQKQIRLSLQKYKSKMTVCIVKNKCLKSFKAVRNIWEVERNLSNLSQ